MFLINELFIGVTSNTESIFPFLEGLGTSNIRKQNVHWRKDIQQYRPLVVRNFASPLVRPCVEVSRDDNGRSYTCFYYQFMQHSLIFHACHARRSIPTVCMNSVNFQSYKPIARCCSYLFDLFVVQIPHFSLLLTVNIPLSRPLYGPVIIVASTWAVRLTGLKDCMRLRID